HVGRAAGRERHHQRNGTRRVGLRLCEFLLRARREWPRRRAAEQRDELAAFHSITSSARPSKVIGNVRPSVFAVFRLIKNSVFVDWWTGRSAVFPLLKTPPT